MTFATISEFNCPSGFFSTSVIVLVASYRGPYSRTQHRNAFSSVTMRQLKNIKAQRPTICLYSVHSFYYLHSGGAASAYDIYVFVNQVGRVRFRRRSRSVDYWRVDGVCLNTIDCERIQIRPVRYVSDFERKVLY